MPIALPPPVAGPYTILYAMAVLRNTPPSFIVSVIYNALPIRDSSRRTDGVRVSSTSARCIVYYPLPISVCDLLPGQRVFCLFSFPHPHPSYYNNLALFLFTRTHVRSYVRVPTAAALARILYVKDFFYF